METEKGFIVAMTDREAEQAAEQIRLKVIDKAKHLMPLMGKILVHKLFIKEKETTASGLVVPAHVQNKQPTVNFYQTSPFQAVVARVGKEFDMGPMNQEKMHLQEGDHIICKNELSDDLKRGAFMYAGMMFTYINQTDVICIVSSKGTQKAAPGATTEMINPENNAEEKHE